MRGGKLLGPAALLSQHLSARVINRGKEINGELVAQRGESQRSLGALQVTAKVAALYSDFCPRNFYPVEILDNCGCWKLLLHRVL